MELNNIRRYGFSNKGSLSPVTSVNGMTGDVSIGGVGGLTCYVNVLDGNDLTAEVGNILRPFQSIHGAVNAVPFGGAIEVFAGIYEEDDSTLPFGMMISSYDFYFHPNAIVNYYGTYGLYISESYKTGNIYGYGKFNVYAPNFTNPYGYAFYVEVSGVPKIFEFVNMIAQYDSSDTDADLVRIGDCALTSASFNFSERILSKRGISILLDQGSRTLIKPTTGAIHQTNSKTPVKIRNPRTVDIKDCVIYGYGTKFGRYQPVLITIEIGGYTEVVNILRTDMFFFDDSYGFKVIEFISGTTSSSKVTIKDSTIVNSNEPGTSGQGDSIYTDYDISVRIINSYAGKPTAGIGTINNLISQGPLLFIEPNIKVR